jgi:hypothetical protein
MNLILIAAAVLAIIFGILEATEVLKENVDGVLISKADKA